MAKGRLGVTFSELYEFKVYDLEFSCIEVLVHHLGQILEPVILVKSCGFYVEHSKGYATQEGSPQPKNLFILRGILCDVDTETMVFLT